MSQSKREKYLEELREHQKGLVNAPAEFHFEVPTLDESKKVEVHAAGGRVFVNSHGEAEFDREAMHTLQQTLASAFQNVA